MSFLGVLFLVVILAFIGFQTYGIVVDIIRKRKSKNIEKKENDGE